MLKRVAMMHSDPSRTLVEVFERSAARFGSRELFGTKIGGKWVFVSYQQVRNLVNDLRAGLAALGVGPGQRIAIISDNRVEWPVVAYATYGLGGTFVPMYPSQLERDWEYILRDSGACVLFVADGTLYRRVAHFAEKIPTLRHIVVLSNEDGELSYSTLLDRGARHPVPLSAVGPDDIASLLYTSGTTGDPKGVTLSHRNIVSNIVSVREGFVVDERDRTLAFLPWAHAFGHTCELHLFVSLGASLAICEGTDKILANLAEVRPTVLVAVPRVFSRLYTAVHRQMESKPRPIAALFAQGIRCATRQKQGESLTLRERASLMLADTLLFAKIRNRLGGKLRYVVSGAAALSSDVSQFLDAVGIVVYEGYGLTEASPIVAVNVPAKRRAGTVGQPIRGVTVRIDLGATGDDLHGEVIAYGPNIMAGYLNQPEATKAVLTADGGLRTGDMGHLDADGYLCVTGRIKEQYKLENGKYVVPAPLEEALKLSAFVANIMVHGDNRPFNVAIVVPNLDMVREWGSAHGLAHGPSEKLLGHEGLRAKIAEELERHSTGFKSYEKVKRFLLIQEDFTQANDMLTPSLKLKRRNVLMKWRAEIAKLYDAADAKEMDTPRAAARP